MTIIYGTNTVRNALEAKRVKKLYVSKNFKHNEITNLANSLSVKIEIVDKQELDKLAKGENHQGIVAFVSPYKTYNLDEVLKSVKDKSDATLLMLDELSDPHNLGAILRSSDAFGIDGVIFKKRGQVGLNDTVAKVSTGAIDYVKCCDVTNLSQTIRALKKEGFWVIGLDGSAKGDLHSIPKNTKLCLVVGSEGFGISRLVKENCDLLVKIPMQGHVSCLNASVAASIVLYQVKN